ncbi:hypothetical protein V496_02507 [Pseudogymnoascus sp. VKM F-4515 (FW-2607)]|nr:hypothetical protein V496_02507 [Pseudogymnoascus sp. VKM F-4515 (FW-2607)]
MKFFILLLGLARLCSGVSYFFDGSANHAGDGSQSHPYNNLTTISSFTLHPGDKILLKRGSSIAGPLVLTSSGSASAPINIGAYGDAEQPKPKVVGGGLSTVLIQGASHVVVEDLEVTNPGDNKSALRGVYIYGYNSGNIRDVTVKNLYIHDVRGYMPSTSTGGAPVGKYANASGAIVIEAGGSTTPTYFTGINIQDNEIRSVDRQGIYTWSNWCQRTELAAFWFTLCTAPWHASSSLLVQRNRLYDIGGDGIVVKGNEGAIVRDNLVVGFNKRSKSPNAGIWTANSINSLFQYNTVSGGTTTSDGMSYDVDHSTSGTVFEYNVSHDNEGGFFLLCPYDKPTTNFTIRYNLSVNDKTRIFQICDGALTGGKVYKNTIQIGSGISPVIVTEDTTDDLDVLFTNNIIHKEGSGRATWKLEDEYFSVVKNSFYGPIDTYSKASGSVTEAPGLAAPGLRDPKSYYLLSGYPTLDVAIDVVGDASVDFFNNPTTVHNNLGFYSGAGTNIPTWISKFDDSDISDWKSTSGSATIVPDPAGDLGNSVQLAPSAIFSRPIGATLPFRLNARIWVDAVSISKPVIIRVGSTSRAVDVVLGNPETYRTGEWQILEVLLTSSSHSAILGGTPLTSVPVADISGLVTFSAGQSKVYIDDIFVTGQ